MNKKDLLPIILIFILFLAYPTIDRKFVAKIFPPKAKPAPVAVEPATAPALPADTTLAAPAASPDAPPPPPPATQEAPAPEEPAGPEILTVLANDQLELTFSSHGAGIVQAAILKYPTAKDDPTPVTFDFSDQPAAAPRGYPGLRELASFEVTAATADSITYRKTLPGGLVLERIITLGAGYQLQLEDRLRNQSAAPVALHGYGIQAGFMENLPGEEGRQQIPLLGVDTLTGSDSVKYWAGKFDKWFPASGPRQMPLIPGPNHEPTPVDWVAVKNKYFTQILTPTDGVSGFGRLFVQHGAPVHSSFLGLFPRTSVPIQRVTAYLEMPDYTLPAGETITQHYTFYAGPKVYAALKANGPHQEDILQLGFWRPIGIFILKIMVWFHDHIWPYNYGLAIILLTFLIRVIFWPLNHKSMVSTRHMQEIQPLITAVREKYKNDPQRQQQEMMALYKEHKINPMGGCLPMLIQIPVFFALFTVLRGAIELRFSSFLWIADLSTPENLLRNYLPFGLNILPLFMGLTMWLQQKMTPTSDPQQQKMMMMMPIIFTFMFYSFPSGLSLYWSTNQVMMIIQLARMRKKHPAPSPAKT